MGMKERYAVKFESQFRCFPRENVLPKSEGRVVLISLRRDATVKIYLAISSFA